uniref:TlpA family protein disulfide reductase n=1 Tax=Fulvivirga sp. TaxID=1931237 RepID=UPI004048ED61
MNLTKSILISILCSLALIPIWGLTLLDAKTSNQWSVALCYLMTPFFIYYLKSNTNIIVNRIPKLLLLVGPFLYFVVSVIAFHNFSQFLVNPILWIIATLLVVLFLVTEMGWKDWILVIFWAYFYTFHIYPYYQKFNQNGSNENEEISTINFDKNNPLDFQFINSNLDTANITSNQKQLLLIETWNETCAPCLKSIKKLEATIDEYSNSLSHIYLYENAGRDLMQPQKVVDFNLIKDKSKIWIDIENEFMSKSGMQSYPYFVLYDSSGVYLDHFVGYSDKEHDKFEKKIKSMIEKNLRSN